MEHYRFRYIKMAHSRSQCGEVLIELERGDQGIPFGMVLSVEDAKRLLDELPDQIQIAAKISN